MTAYLLITLLCVLLALAIVTTSDGARVLYDGSTDGRSSDNEEDRASVPRATVADRRDDPTARTVAAPRLASVKSVAPPRGKIGKAAFYDSRCGDAWQAVRFYRARYDAHREVMHLRPAPPVEQAMSCRRLRERAAYWVRAAKHNRNAARKWGRTIHIRPDWKTSAIEVQKVYPGTYGWLMSCSSAEGGHGRWVWYGGRSWNGYHIGGDTVGGQMQFRYSTFAPYYRHAITDLRTRHYIIPDLGSGYRPWLSPLGQAITAGYMRYYGKDGHHWSASAGNGC